MPILPSSLTSGSRYGTYRGLSPSTCVSGSRGKAVTVKARAAGGPAPGGCDPARPGPVVRGRPVARAWRASSARSEFAANLRGPAGWEVEFVSPPRTRSDPERSDQLAWRGPQTHWHGPGCGRPAACFCSCNFKHKGVLGPCPLASGSAPRINHCLVLGRKHLNFPQPSTTHTCTRVTKGQGR